MSCYAQVNPVRYLILVVPLVLVACGSDPTFTEVQAQVFTPSCAAFSSCHSGSAPAGGLNLVAPAYEQLVGKGSTAAAGKILVVAGSPDTSYLVDKLRKRPGIEGDQMPNTAPIEEERIQLVEDWIAAGAKND